MSMENYADILEIEQPQAATRSKFQDPAVVMGAISKRVGKWFAALEQHYGTSVVEFMDHLRQREPRIKQRLDAIWLEVDNDVFGRYMEGVLADNDYRHWRRNLSEWVNLLHAAIALFRLHHGEDVASDVSISDGSA